jgi:hypothetical protein
MSNDYKPPHPSDLALEQLIWGIVFYLEEEKPGAMKAIFRIGAGFPRFSVVVDRFYRDLCETIRSKARRAGLLK